jgi:hypothetical protein
MTAETLVLDSPASLPEVPLHPAPWRLRASAYAVMARLPAGAGDDAWFVPPSLRGRPSAQLAFLIYVDYEDSDCGPYHELMAARCFDFGDRQRASITRIYVSTHDSVVDGRRNWGIPKDRADFVREPLATGGERITVSRDGRCVARLELQGLGFVLPVTSAMLLPSIRTIAQHWQGQEYRIPLTAKGKARLARVLDWSFDGALFPDFTTTKVVAASHLPKFEMTFPVATVTPIG